MYQANAYAARSADQPLRPYKINRRSPGAHDVQIEILYSGVCHTDLHYVRNEWESTIYPIVPGHEIIGRVVKTGKNVSKFREDDFAGVGPLIDSCHHCEACRKGLEQYCENGTTQVFNDKERKTGALTYGGYSDSIVVHEDFALLIPKTLDLKTAAPLLCAGITTFSPLSHWRIGEGHTVGIIGIGGLGHLGVKFAKAKGARVVAITTSRWKLMDAKRLGAHEAILSTDGEALRQHASSLDFIIDTIPVSHDINPYVDLLRRDGTMVILGVFEPLEPGLDNSLVASWRRSVSGSVIGSIAETQRMIDLCSRQHIATDVEVIPIQKINEAFDQMLKREVKYRFVIDMSTLK